MPGGLRIKKVLLACLIPAGKDARKARRFLAVRGGKLLALFMGFIFNWASLCKR